jgi:hypothetical protein
LYSLYWKMIWHFGHCQMHSLDFLARVSLREKKVQCCRYCQIDAEFGLGCSVGGVMLLGHLF